MQKEHKADQKNYKEKKILITKKKRIKEQRRESLDVSPQALDQANNSHKYNVAFNYRWKHALK